MSYLIGCVSFGVRFATAQSLPFVSQRTLPIHPESAAPIIRKLKNASFAQKIVQMPMSLVATRAQCHLRLAFKIYDTPDFPAHRPKYPATSSELPAWQIK